MSKIDKKVTISITSSQYDILQALPRSLNFSEVGRKLIDALECLMSQTIILDPSKLCITATLEE